MSQSVPSDPISHCPWDGLDRMGTSQSFSCSIPYPYCPSHPIVPWDGQNGNAPKRAMQYTLSLLSIPSHCTMGQIGQTGNTWGDSATERSLYNRVNDSSLWVNYIALHPVTAQDIGMLIFFSE